MKKFFSLILFFGTFIQLFACRCVDESIAKRYLDADVVALVTIEKTYGEIEYDPPGTGLRTYSADLKFEKIYKGVAFKTLNVFGGTASFNSGACEKLVMKGEKYLVILSKNTEGLYYVSSCSTMPQISDDKYLKEYENIFKLLEKKRSHLHFTKFVQYRDSSEDYDHQANQITNDFLKLSDKRLHGKLGIYKVKISQNNRISDIKVIHKIGIKEKQIQELMKKNLRAYQGFITAEGEYFILLEL